MMTLHISLKIKKERVDEFEDVYMKGFVPAITKQDGFYKTQLLKKFDFQSHYEINIYFESEESRLKWVDSKEHQEVWPKIENLIEEVYDQKFFVLSEEKSK